MPLDLFDSLLNVIDGLQALTMRPLRLLTVAGLLLIGCLILKRGEPFMLGIGMVVVGVCWGALEGWLYYTRDHFNS